MKVKFSKEFKSVINHLTPEKEYELIPSKTFGELFSIIDDDGDEITCRWEECAHLNGVGIWEKVE